MQNTQSNCFGIIAFINLNLSYIQEPEDMSFQ